ncbi:MAG: phosphomethylpyrimidine synthase ThiC, partial [Rhodobacteraceae bacterium]|nr:phosphomethylpyrimidine synthase ThiC [Paracoccaceae bacterium]
MDLSVTSGPLPASRKVYVKGRIHADIKVAMREIEVEASAKEPPVMVYDPSGPYTDPAITTDIRRGLAPLRAKWIETRGDVEAITGREIKPEDNGLKPGEALAVPAFDRAGRKPLRALAGKNVTQLAYARAGIVTPEMEYIAIRENQ